MALAAASLLLHVGDETQVADARRAVAELSRQQGWTEHDAAKVALIVTEAATNLIKHARGGRLVIRPLLDGAGPAIEILSLDSGPGMARIDRCLRDGYSTAGSPGTGLGALSRLADVVDIYSQVGVGTAMLIRIGRADDHAVNNHHINVGAVSVPKIGETECGDAWAMRPAPQGRQLLVVDGLGHGPLAAAAAREARRIFLEGPLRSAAGVLETLHAGLHGTRGAVAGVVDIDIASHVVTFAGAGNVAASVVASESTRSLVSHNGTLGREVHRFQEFSCPFEPGALLVIHTDGLRQHWRLSEYSGLAQRDPALIAGVLYRDFSRDRDDVTIVVARRAGDR